MNWILILMFISGVVVGVSTWILIRQRKRSSQPVAIAEYWVYSAAVKIPDEKLLMDRVVGANPHTKRGVNPIGPAEGLVFSDVRWKLSLILRSKNQSLFDIRLAPDVLQDSLGFAEALLDCNSIIKLQYVSSTKLPDRRHLQFLLHVADAIADKVESSWIYDKSAEKLWSSQELRDRLSLSIDVTDLETHTHMVENEDHTIESRGLKKIGVHEFVTNPVSHDQMMLARDLLSQYVQRSWQQGESVWEPIVAYGDEFTLKPTMRKDGRHQLKVLRKQGKN